MHGLRRRFLDACWEAELKHVIEAGASQEGGFAETFDAWRKAIVEANWFRQALSNARIALAAQDAEMRYVWVFKPYGPTPAETMIGRSDEDLWPPEVAAPVVAFKRKVFEARKGARSAFTIATKEGELVIDVRCEPVLDADGATIGLLCAAIDVSREADEYKRLAASREKAESALFAKNQAIARASHDLRQPFQAMRMLHEVLSHQPLGERERLIVDKLGEAMHSGEALLSSLLEYSVMDTRLQVVRLEDFPLQEVFDSLHAETGALAEKKGLDCRMVPTRAWIMSDRILLSRMLRNLLVNAVRYTRRGKVLLGCVHRGEEIEIRVCDTGIGVPEDQQGLIFEDFYRADAGAGEGGGLGLGLAGVARMSRMLVHPVGVRSQPGRGSIFTVRVPRSHQGGGRQGSAPP